LGPEPLLALFIFADYGLINQPHGLNNNIYKDYLSKDNIILGEIMDDIKLRIIGQYERNPKAVFTINQISKALGATYSHVYKNIIELVDEGVLKRAKKGNTSLCALNLKNDRALLMLALVSQETRDKYSGNKKLVSKLVNELIESLKPKTDLRMAALFGSYATGSEREDSDVDLLLISNSENVVHREIGTLEMKYGKSINPVIATERMFVRMLKHEKLNVAKEVLREGIIFFGFEKYWMLVGEAV
jgi:predicted nucleotidyltransferase